MAEDQVDPSIESALDTGWRDEDLRRAIAVAEDAGLTSYRIEIAPDGTITIFVGDATPDDE